MRGCLKHHSSSPSPSSTPSPTHSPSPSNPSSIATPPPTRGSTPLLLPLDAPSLSSRRRPEHSLTDACLTRRCVHFCSELVDKVFVADEWDRSPAEVTPRLTYQDMLELKEIQRSLPHAPQPFRDPDLPELDARGAPRTHFLNTVPVGLVPLINPDTSMAQPKLATTPPVIFKPKTAFLSTPSRSPPSPPSTPPPSISVTPSCHKLDPLKPPSRAEPWVPPPPPPRLPYNIPAQPRPMPRFNFLPLLESPVSPGSSVSLRSKSPPRQVSLRPSSPVPLPSPPDITPDQIPYPPCPSSLQSDHGVGPTESLRSTSVDVPIASRPAKPLNATVPLLPLLPNHPEDITESVHDGSSCLEAELSLLWRKQSSVIDAETETESEAESSVVHTEAESDGESTRSVAAFSSSKANRPPVAVVTSANDDEDEGEMSLIELESGVMAFVRVSRRK